MSNEIPTEVHASQENTEVGSHSGAIVPQRGQGMQTIKLAMVDVFRVLKIFGFSMLGFCFVWLLCWCVGLGCRRFLVCFLAF
jgi:hypothetical protein